MSEKVWVNVDASRWTGRLGHHWNYIGYDECNYTHSPGGMALLAKISGMEKPYYIRTHHMLCTGIRHGFYKWGSTDEYRVRGWCQPPRDYNRWYDLIYRLAIHLLERYGLEEVEKWYFRCLPMESP